MSHRLRTDILEWYEKFQEVNRDLTAIPGPNNKYLRRISVEGNQKNRRADEYSTEYLPHPRALKLSVVFSLCLVGGCGCLMMLTERKRLRLGLF